MCSISGGGYEEPLATCEDELTGLLPKLAKALKGAAPVVDSFLEVECRSLFTAASTRFFSHLYLQDPSFDLGADPLRSS